MAPPNAPPLPVSKKAWHGGIKFPQLVKDELPSGGGEGHAVKRIATTTALGFAVNYEIHPQFAPGGIAEVLYYHAYNPDMDRDDYVISPEALDEFIANAAMLCGFADQWYIFSAGSDYTVESAAAVDKMMDFQIRDAFGKLASAWWKAIKDPSWWLQIFQAMSAGAGKPPKPGSRPFLKPGVAGRKLTPPQMATHLCTTWEANELLQRVGEANELARKAPPAVVHRELIDILKQFEEEEGIDVQRVPKGTIPLGPDGKPNFASLSNRPGVLQIDQRVFRSTVQLQNEIEHELAAHFTGAPPNSNIPRLGDSQWFAHNLLEEMFKTNGRIGPGAGFPLDLVPNPPRGNIARFVATLVANDLRYPPRNDKQAREQLAALHGADPRGLSPAEAFDPFGNLLQTLGTSAPEPGPGEPGPDLGSS